MKRRVLVTATLLAVAGCSRPESPSPDYARLHQLLDQLQAPNATGQGHGAYHRANDAWQREFWQRLQELPDAEGVDRLIEAAVEKVYTRYDANYYNGILYHWPYLCSRRAVTLCDRALRAFPDSPARAKLLWLRAFALRAPAMDPWEQAEKDLETYAEQVRWKPDFEAAREVYRRLAAEYPESPYGRAAARLADAPDLSVVLPRGPREPDLRDPGP